MTKTRYPELGFSKIGTGWRMIDATTQSAVGPYYRSRAELLADLARYAASFGCEEPTALRQLPSMPKMGEIAVDEWEPVVAIPCKLGCGKFHTADCEGKCEDAGVMGKAFDSERTGYTRRKGWRKVTDVRNDLAIALEQYVPDEYRKLDYFSTRSGAPASWEQGVIACFPVVGGSEGYYFHVDVIVPRKKLHEPDKWHSLILGKTLEEGQEGFAVVARCAAVCARLLGA